MFCVILKYFICTVFYERVFSIFGTGTVFLLAVPIIVHNLVSLAECILFVLLRFGRINTVNVIKRFLQYYVIEIIEILLSTC